MITENDCIDAIEQVLKDEFGGVETYTVGREFGTCWIDIQYGKRSFDYTTLTIELLNGQIGVYPPGMRVLVDVPLAHPRAFETMVDGIKVFQVELLQKGVLAIWPDCPAHLIQ